MECECCKVKVKDVMASQKYCVKCSNFIYKLKKENNKLKFDNNRLNDKVWKLEVLLDG